MKNDDTHHRDVALATVNQRNQEMREGRIQGTGIAKTTHARGLSASPRFQGKFHAVTTSSRRHRLKNLSEKATRSSQRTANLIVP